MLKKGSMRSGRPAPKGGNVGQSGASSPAWLPDRPALLSAAILAAGTIAIYGGTLSVPMLLDDKRCILDNSTIRHLWPVGPVLTPPADAGVGGRPLLNLSFALNYAAGGTAVPGYHLINQIIHVLAGIVLFALVRRTLRSPTLLKRFGDVASPIALSVSAIWLWHPLQTESVTYISERSESLMGLFYLLTLYCFARGSGAGSGSKRLLWFALAPLACLSGVGVKEVIVTAPVMVLLYDRTFYSGSFLAALRRNWPLHLAMAATWIPLGLLMTGLSRRGVGFGSEVTPWAYALVESRAVVRYVMLCFWPSPLIFDYGAFIPATFSEALPYIAAVASLAAFAVWMLGRRPALGFTACWFFLILAPTSSFVPLAAQPTAESRLYLPLAGVVTLVVVGVFSLAGPRCFRFLVCVAIGVGLLAAQRNQAYGSEQEIWIDTVAKNPGSARAHNNLGNVWLETPGRFNDAVVEYQEAVRLGPELPEAHNNLGSVWARTPGKMNDAIAQFREALRLRPDFAEAHNNLGNALSFVPGRTNEAVSQYEDALRLRPDWAGVHGNLARALDSEGSTREAINQYREAVRLQPGFVIGHLNLAAEIMKVPGHGEEARAEILTALRLQPENERARQMLTRISGSQP
jgi:tetratricopeptide (TPR) repeat protein